ncbi:MAG: glycosyltransferase family 87 protein [Candidatus Omnitrophica bacterium]|nr:glycosyltransferase family 87 protein [Candidatus Omnitrophota bacterium]MDD5610520.1 glycosyltransferase family 87 protein [Candidatus Omnitrophota bacterium]
MKRKSVYFFIILAGFLAVMTYFLALAKEIKDSPFDDYKQYWFVSFMLENGHNVWDVNQQDRIEDLWHNFSENPYAKPIHSSGFFLCMVPFTFLPLRAGAIVWLVLGHLALLISLWLIWKMYARKIGSDGIFVALFLVFSFWPVREQLVMGQPNFFILLFLTLGLFMINRNRPFSAGLILALAVLFREYFVILILYFLWKRKWKVTLGIILGYLMIKACAILAFGLDKEIAYWQYMYSTFVSKHASYITNYSLSANILRIGKGLLGEGILSSIAWLFSGVFLFRALALTKDAENPGLEFCLFVILAFLLSPWVHESHYVALYLPILILWFLLDEAEAYNLFPLFISAYLLLALRYSFVRFNMFYAGIPAIANLGKPMGVILLFFLTGKLLRKKTQMSDAKETNEC